MEVFIAHNIYKFRKSSNAQLEDAIKRLAEDHAFSDLLSEFHDLAEGGYPEAYYYIGCIYEDGDKSVKQDYEKAFFYYQKSVDEVGYLEGILAVAKFCLYGIGVEKDYESAYGWYSLAAEKADDAIAQMMLGKIHHLGLGVEVNYAKAEEYFNRAIEKGNVYALVFLGRLKEEQGQKLKGSLLRYKAGILATYLAWKNKSDIRLRQF